MGFWGKLSGKDVSNTVDEYSRVFSEILTGYEQELEHFKKRIDYIENQLNVPRDLRAVYRKIENLKKGLIVTSIISGVSILWLIFISLY